MSSCTTFPKNLTVTHPRPSFERTECSGPQALLAVQTEPHDHMHLSKQIMCCVNKHGRRDRSARCLPLSIFHLATIVCSSVRAVNIWIEFLLLFFSDITEYEDSQCLFLCVFFCNDTITSAVAEIGHIPNALNQ